jgi:hypothetical protein
MTKTATHLDVAPEAAREPRPFLYLEPARLPLRNGSCDPQDRHWLEHAVMPSVPALVRSLVDCTIERQNRKALAHGMPQPIQLSVLNRRRRAARSWVLAILSAKVDAATRHAVATQWVPMLAGTGPDLKQAIRAGRVFVEFLRGAITACVFDEPADNLLPHARALHVVETTLSVHLAEILRQGRAVAAT